MELVHKGKVRDVYQAGLNDLLMIACDRLSAFDVVLPDPIPGKGAMLNQMAKFWFKQTEHIVPNHLLDLSVASVVGDHPQLKLIEPRAMVVKKLKPVPFEAIVRGYLAGSGWKDYQKHGAISGVHIPANMSQAEKLPQPIFTPSTKAAVGDHDENVSYQRMAHKIGDALTEKIKNTSLALYKFASEHALARGIIIADTKFEFGLDEVGNLVLMDEIFTPDSSRFWPQDKYQTGISPPSFDKQFVRDHLESIGWNKQAPGPALPADIIEKTAARYQEAMRRLMS